MYAIIKSGKAELTAPPPVYGQNNIHPGKINDAEKSLIWLHPT